MLLVYDSTKCVAMENKACICVLYRKTGSEPQLMLIGMATMKSLELRQFPPAENLAHCLQYVSSLSSALSKYFLQYAQIII